MHIQSYIGTHNGWKLTFKIWNLTASGCRMLGMILLKDHHLLLACPLLRLTWPHSGAVITSVLSGSCLDYSNHLEHIPGSHRPYFEAVLTSSRKAGYSLDWLQILHNIYGVSFRAQFFFSLYIIKDYQYLCQAFKIVCSINTWNLISLKAGGMVSYRVNKRKLFQVWQIECGFVYFNADSRDIYWFQFPFSVSHEQKHFYSYC